MLLRDLEFIADSWVMYMVGLVGTGNLDIMPTCVNNSVIMSACETNPDILSACMSNILSCIRVHFTIVLSSEIQLIGNGNLNVYWKMKWYLLMFDM